MIIVAVTDLEKQVFDSNPSDFIKKLIAQHVATSPENRLPAFDYDPIYDEPLTGFADGDDPVFKQFKSDSIIGDFHCTPREALTKHLSLQGKKDCNIQPEHISVIVFIFPFTEKNIISGRGETEVCSLRLNHANTCGRRFHKNSVGYVASVLEELGYQTVAPSCTVPEQMLFTAKGPVSDWSEKHAAYAAGLGTFSYSGSIISEKGKAVRLASIITGLQLPPTPRLYSSYMSHCLRNQNGSCHRCIDRCPSSALSDQGYDSKKCTEYNNVTVPGIVKEKGREGYDSDHIICGLCESKVPCEDRLPHKKQNR
ncbi:hypothetical protein ACFLYM_01070 [Chloroflexota bacterium]